MPTSLAIASIAVNVILSGVIIFLTVRYNRRTTRLAEEQLEIARRQAASFPNVEFLNAYLKNIRDESTLQEEVTEEFESSKKLRRQQEDEKRRREVHERSGSHMPYISTLYTGRGLIYGPYEGPYPSHFLCIRIGNSGGAAARRVTGWVNLDGAVLEPVDRFLDTDVEILDQRSISMKLKLTVPNEESTLLVAGEAEHVFRIPVVLHKVEDTSLPWELSNSQEEPKSGTFYLPASSFPASP